MAAASSWRGTTASIRSHTASNDSTAGPVISPVSVSTCSAVVSKTTWNAAASFAEARSTRGSVFIFSLTVSRSALASSFVAISASRRSSASSTARVIR
ncbi:hypothetical protein [Streptomyces sp. Midd1]|uniref:hypothetical protein n=1 Tax=Streptomyces sp. Midd3 TaxID=3161191 RepID=UPI0034DB1420